MRIKILFDKNAPDKKLHAGWGVSFLIGDKIVFDTGEKGPWLMENMTNLGVDIAGIESVVISHDHWDHTGGLWALLEKRRGLTTYACPHFSGEFKEKVQKSPGTLIEADKLKEISGNIFITGEIPGVYHGKHMPEQALAVRTENGISVITGCAHPGISKMVAQVKAAFSNEPIYLVSGGFHLMESDQRAIETVVGDFKKMGVKKVGPTHCSGPKAEEFFEQEYGDNFTHIIVGETSEI